MRAIVFEKPGDESVLRIGEVEDPKPKPGELLIRVAATAVNRADLLQRQGLYPPPRGASPVLGLECAGVVAALGEGVAGWNVGDRAMALLAGGGYAELATVDAGSAMPVPEGFSDEEAGAFPEVFLTSFLNVFQIGAPPAGGSVLVHGGGSGVGTATISLCREAGLRVIVTAGSAEKCRRCLEHGADAAIDYRAGDFAPAVLEATDGRGAEVVLDSIGGRYLDSNLAALATGGALVVIGLIGGARAELNLATVMMKRVRLVGSTLRARPVAEKAAIVAGLRERFGDALRAGRLRPVIEAVMPLERAADAHRLVQSSAHFGKVVLRVGG
jgi:putative PIG3 family NAD(P)H quinone oxidoreductase